jgi:hypothetical protein
MTGQLDLKNQETIQYLQGVQDWCAFEKRKAHKLDSLKHLDADRAYRKRETALYNLKKS